MNHGTSATKIERARRKGAALYYVRGAMIFVALLLPVLSLLPLGWLWLWQRGYALYWLAGAFTVSASAYLFEWLALRRGVAQAAIPDKSGPQPGDPGWTARENAAWAAVEAIAANVKSEELNDRDKMLNLGLRTIEAVARQIHPQDQNPLWKFTVPEALALIERVSADLRPFVIDNVPLGDQLTVGQLLSAYRWRSAIGFAEKAYDIWRLVRLVNPVTAAAQEAREHLTKHLYATVRDELGRQIARAYIREVGRAAIDLYGGRLKVSNTALAGHVSSSTQRDRLAPAPMAEPLRVFVGGQKGAGKSSLINALSKRAGEIVDALPATETYQPYEMELAGLKSAIVIDSPTVGTRAKDHRRFCERAAESDLVIWAVAANEGADAATDRAVIEEIRKYFVDRPHRRQPPLIVALTHIDALQPGVLSAATIAGGAILERADQVAEELGLDKADVVPVSVAAGREPFNIGELCRRIASHVPEAQRAQLLRLMEDAAPRWSVLRLGKQATNAVASAARSVTPGFFKRGAAPPERR
jgi:predicted GTPase